MDIKQLLTAIIFGGCALALSAETVTLTEAGTLADKIQTPSAVTSLTISGPINAADFHYINKSLTNLTSLDLSQAAIKAYSGTTVLLNRTEFPANYLPDFALAGSKIRSIMLPSTLTAIGEGALSSTPIANIDLASTAVTEIGNGAFSNCDELVSLSIPAAVSSIGEAAFSRCDKLATVSLSGANIPAQAFAYCSKLSKVTFSAEPRTIGERAFAGCAALKEFSFPTSITAIGPSAFENSGIENANMLNCSSLTTIADWAFAKCSGLLSATLPVSLTYLGQGVFFDDASLTVVNIPYNISTLPDYVFKGNSSAQIDGIIHDGTVRIGHYALKGMSDVTYMSLPATLEYIGDEGMAGMTALTTIQADSLKSVPELGEDVWNGVNQANVKLIVDSGIKSEFLASSQWNEFRIELTSGTDDPIADAIVAKRVKAWFSGTDLYIQADDNIDEGSLFDINGRLLVALAPSDNMIVVDTSSFGDHIYIIRIKLVDGTPAVIKISR